MQVATRDIVENIFDKDQTDFCDFSPDDEWTTLPLKKLLTSTRRTYEKELLHQYTVLAIR